MIIEALVVTGCAIVGVPIVYASVRALRIAIDAAMARDDRPSSPKICYACKFLATGTDDWGAKGAPYCAAREVWWPQTKANKAFDCELYRASSKSDVVLASEADRPAAIKENDA